MRNATDNASKAGRLHGLGTGRIWRVVPGAVHDIVEGEVSVRVLTLRDVELYYATPCVPQSGGLHA